MMNNFKSGRKKIQIKMGFFPTRKSFRMSEDKWEPKAITFQNAVLSQQTVTNLKSLQLWNTEYCAVCTAKGQ